MRRLLCRTFEAIALPSLLVSEFLYEYKGGYAGLEHATSGMGMKKKFLQNIGKAKEQTSRREESNSLSRPFVEKGKPGKRGWGRERHAIDKEGLMLQLPIGLTHFHSGWPGVGHVEGPCWVLHRSI